MSKDYYEFKKDCPRRQVTQSNLIVRMNQLTKANEGFQVKIDPCNKRSKNALAAYWMLINSVVRWSTEQGNSYTDKDFDEWFKKEAGLTQEVDIMSMWKMKYRDKMDDGGEFIYNGGNEESYAFITKDYYPTKNSTDKFFYLGKRYIQKTRSISNKGDVSKSQMEKLIHTILEFGATNDIKECVITNAALDRLLKFCEG